MGTLPQTNYSTKAGESNVIDRCGTPSYALAPLVPYINALQERLGRKLIVWESACGEGLLVDALTINGYQVIATDLLTGTDYFSYQPDDYDFEATNVPFSRKYEWIKLACERGKPFALLAPSSTMFAGKGQALIEQYGIEILAPNSRIDFKMPNMGWGKDGKKSTAQFHSSWFTRGLEIGQRLTYVKIVKPRMTRKMLMQMEYHPEQLEPPKEVFVQTAHF